MHFFQCFVTENYVSIKKLFQNGVCFYVESKEISHNAFLRYLQTQSFVLNKSLIKILDQFFVGGEFFEITVLSL